MFYKNIVRIPIILGRNKFYVEGIEVNEEDLSEKIYFDTDAASPIIAPKKFKGDYNIGVLATITSIMYYTLFFKGIWNEIFIVIGQVIIENT